MLEIKDFNAPETHPFGMLDGLINAAEKESVLFVILLKSIKDHGEFVPIKLNYGHPSMVSDGLLNEVGERTYELTRKAKGLLYAYYGKE